MARHVAKSVVGANMADKCQIGFAYAIGVDHPVAVQVETFGTEQIEPEKISARVSEVFDLSPRGIIDYLGLLDTKYLPTAKNGHFGNPSFPWERTTDAEKLLA